MLKKCMLVLFVLICAWQLASTEKVRAETAKTYDGTSSEEHQKGLIYVNQIRKGMGLTELVLEPSLTKAAINHATYLETHNKQRDSADLAGEEEGTRYFTGKTPEKRAVAAGYTGNNEIQEAIMLEERTFDQFDMATYMRSMSLVHDWRVVMTNPNTVAIGIARVGKATVMVGTVSKQTETDVDLQVGVYPYNGMTEAAVMTDGFFDYRNPLEGKGMTITVHTNRNDVSGMEATLQRQSTEREILIPLDIVRMEKGDGFVLTAKRHLRGDVVYMASVSFRVGGVSVEKEWTFRTYPFTSDLYIDDMPVYSIPYHLIEGRVTLPMRLLFERFGARVDWNGTKQTITAIKDGLTLQMVVGSDTAYVNGQAVTLDIPPYLSAYTTYVPMRFIAETFGYEVNYLESNHTIEIWTE